jgi:type IV pilus assembly protein PilA
VGRMMSRGKSSGSKLSSGALGFSLIELLIVVAIILVIAAIAIPNFMRSRMAANEAACVQNMRNIVTANVVFSSTYGVGYAPPPLSTLGPPPGNGPPTVNNASLIDDILALGTKSGYSFTYLTPGVGPAGTTDSYTLNADPVSPGVTGTRHFYTDQSGVVHQNLTAPATPTDPPIG